MTALDQIIESFPALAELHPREVLAASLATWIHRMEVLGRVEETMRQSDD